MELISVICPVYNVEKYLPKCIESILSQTYENLEVILADDGSTDNSGKICDEYAEKNGRIMVIHKENGGLSDARNAGIDAANGAYIFFVDADDYIQNDTIEKLYNRIIKDGSDMAICNFKYVDENYSDIPEKNIKTPINDELLSTRECLMKLGGFKHWYYAVAWNKLYKRELFKDIRFPKGKSHEDEFVAHYIIGKCGSVSCVKEPLYYYVQRTGSIMAESISMKRLQDASEALFDRARYALSIDMAELASGAMRGVIYSVSEGIAALKGDRSYSGKVKQIKAEYDEIYRKIVSKNIGLKNKIVLTFFFLSPDLYGGIRAVVKRLIN